MTIRDSVTEARDDAYNSRHELNSPDTVTLVTPVATLRWSNKLCAIVEDSAFFELKTGYLEKRSEIICSLTDRTPVLAMACNYPGRLEVADVMLIFIDKREYIGSVFTSVLDTYYCSCQFPQFMIHEFRQHRRQIIERIKRKKPRLR